MVRKPNVLCKEHNRIRKTVAFLVKQLPCSLFTRVWVYLNCSGKRLTEQHLITSGSCGRQGHVKHALNARTTSEHPWSLLYTIERREQCFNCYCRLTKEKESIPFSKILFNNQRKNKQTTQTQHSSRQNHRKVRKTLEQGKEALQHGHKIIFTCKWDSTSWYVKISMSQGQLISQCLITLMSNKWDINTSPSITLLLSKTNLMFSPLQLLLLYRTAFPSGKTAEL